MADEKKNNSVPAKAEHTAVKKVDNPQKLGLFKRIAKWFRELKSELKKVVWPTPKQTANNTGVALAVMAVSAVAILCFDEIAQNVVQAVITLVG